MVCAFSPRWLDPRRRLSCAQGAHRYARCMLAQQLHASPVPAAQWGELLLGPGRSMPAASTLVVPRSHRPGSQGRTGQGMAWLQDPLGHRPELCRTGSDPGTSGRRPHTGRVRGGPRALAGAAAVAARTRGGCGLSAGLYWARDPSPPPRLLRLADRWRPFQRGHRVPSHPVEQRRLT